MSNEYERGHAAGREAGIREAAEIAIKAAIAAAEKAPTNGLSAEGFKSDCIAIEQRQHWKGIRRGGLAAKTAILALLDAPAPAGVTVQEAAKVLLDQPYSAMEKAFDAMEAKHGEGSDRIMAAALRALSEAKP